MIGAPWSLQLGLYARLQQSTDLQAMLGDPARLYDAVPPDAIFPFATIGEAQVKDYPGVSGAFEHEIRIHIYSRWGGRKEVKEITDIVQGLLHDASFSLTDHRVAHSRLMFADIFRQADAETFQAVTRFRIITEPTF